ncbi:hypothetical protein PVAND_010601 [Polypedilum vanderplanki]|uniref:Uncharacterized protein n=1 Tax=Polypedilum vanderplanki TaxID=319348 RepID=A0A9J6CGS0_POLVA|nr:hypothetical protein PVAND_010601 [Polypedilum vanderplanki]
MKTCILLIFSVLFYYNLHLALGGAENFDQIIEIVDELSSPFPSFAGSSLPDCDVGPFGAPLPSTTAACITGRCPKTRIIFIKHFINNEQQCCCIEWTKFDISNNKTS